MKKMLLKILFTILILIISVQNVKAVQFDLLVLPTNIFSVCDNYFCLPETSEIIADNVIQNLNAYKNINAVQISNVRAKLAKNSELKQTTEKMLHTYEQSEKIDFDALKTIATEFNVKSIVLISSYATTEDSNLKRDLWEILEISNAFRTSYPFNLQTSVVLTDTVNDIVMWSCKYNKTVTDTEGKFIAQNQAQAASQYEKIKQYSKSNISQNISQNIRLRFFPRDVRTFTVNKSTEEKEEKKFVPNALEHLINPQMIRELEEGSFNTINPADDFIFQF